MNGAASGRIFENFVVAEILKYFAYSQSKVNLTYFRDSNAKEIDLLIERNMSVHPFEIKKTANPSNRDISKFAVLDKAPIARSYGGVICMCEEAIPVDEKNTFIPCNLI